MIQNIAHTHGILYTYLIVHSQIKKLSVLMFFQQIMYNKVTNVMKVKELIEKLKSFDEDLEVFLDTYTPEGLPETSLGVYDVRLEKYDKIDKQYVSILYDYTV